MTVTTGGRVSRAASAASSEASGASSSGPTETSSATDTIRTGTSNSLARTSTSSSLSDCVMVFISPRRMSSLMTSVGDLPILPAKSVTQTPRGTMISLAAGGAAGAAATGCATGGAAGAGFGAVAATCCGLEAG